MKKLSLGELRRATGGLEAIFLTFLHSRVTGQQARFLQNGTEVLGIVLQQRARNTVADGAGLAGDAAAAYTADNVELFVCAGELQRLTDDQLQCLQAEIIVDGTVVDGNLTASLVNPYAGDRAFSSAGAVEIRRFLVRSEERRVGKECRL